MNERAYRTYTREFKLEALELLKNSGRGSAKIERELGITRGLLLKWRDRYQIRQNGTEKQLESSNLESANAEVRRSECVNDLRQLGSEFTL